MRLSTIHMHFCKEDTMNNPFNLNFVILIHVVVILHKYRSNIQIFSFMEKHVNYQSVKIILQWNFQPLLLFTMCSSPCGIKPYNIVIGCFSTKNTCVALRIKSKTSLPGVRMIWSSGVTYLQMEWVSEWLLLKRQFSIFQLYHGENKLISSEMMMVYKWMLFQSTSTIKKSNWTCWSRVQIGHHHHDHHHIINVELVLAMI